MNSTARPYDEWAFSPLKFTADWLLHMALAKYMFVIFYFDALAQASDFRIERRRVVFSCWMQDSKLGSVRHQFASRQYPLTNSLSYRGSSKNSTTRPIKCEHSAHLILLHCRLAFAPGPGDTNEIWGVYFHTVFKTHLHNQIDNR